MKASIVYQQCQFKVNIAVFLKTKICGEWLVYAEQVTNYYSVRLILCVEFHTSSGCDCHSSIDENFIPKCASHTEKQIAKKYKKLY